MQGSERTANSLPGTASGPLAAGRVSINIMTLGLIILKKRYVFDMKMIPIHLMQLLPLPLNIQPSQVI